MRYDLIGPRSLRPAVQEPSRPPQPALVLVEPQILSKADIELFKAIREHVDCLNKALSGKQAAEAWEKFEAPKHEGSMPTGLHQMAKFSRQWEGPQHVAVRSGHVDVSSPEHDHARLVAKRAYLHDKIQGHANAGHDWSHPMLQHRQRVLSQVEDKLKSYADRGVKSGPDHHKDWVVHYSGPQHGHSDEHASTGTTYHTRVQNPTPSEQQKELWTKTASPGTGGAKTDESHVDVTGAFSPQTHPHEAKTGKMSAQEISTMKKVAQPPARGPKGTAVVSTPHVSKGNDPLFVKGDTKGDKWISDKISLLVREGKPQKQAVAIAFDMAGRARKSAPLFLSV